MILPSCKDIRLMLPSVKDTHRDDGFCSGRTQWRIGRNLCIPSSTLLNCRDYQLSKSDHIDDTLVRRSDGLVIGVSYLGSINLISLQDGRIIAVEAKIQLDSNLKIIESRPSFKLKSVRGVPRVNFRK
ncbi:tRNA (guanine-N(1)-)-methyltransferase [Striga asiatica]|uniref:tRNA (Guanine-N(1)-)-methyltransferase n=1 Tax=Striga asiatica TaxID=4170 RepID=A0A5A7QDK9_STRAF|nr:tRNA (guanine-N(1)-)-methyltransferase [Striga asiatica]